LIVPLIFHTPCIARWQSVDFTLSAPHLTAGAFLRSCDSGAERQPIWRALGESDLQSNRATISQLFC
jgi:hypothetical protein